MFEPEKSHVSDTIMFKTAVTRTGAIDLRIPRLNLRECDVELGLYGWARVPGPRVIYQLTHYRAMSLLRDLLDRIVCRAALRRRNGARTDGSYHA